MLYDLRYLSYAFVLTSTFHPAIHCCMSRVNGCFLFLFFCKFRYLDCRTVWYVIGVLDYFRVMFYDVWPHGFCTVKA